MEPVAAPTLPHAPRDHALGLRTAAWYGDRELELTLPGTWTLDLHEPRPAPELGEEAIASLLDRPLGQPPLAVLARGKHRPLVIVDDLNRPTPASRVLPALLGQLRRAGVDLGAVTILMAPGTHGPPRAGAIEMKVGREAAAVCRLAVHDCHRDAVRIGRTSRGAVVEINPLVMESDLVLGVGGVYPNQTAGFGGGNKLALGVLGFRSIAALHHGHQPAGWGNPAGEFREALDEVASMIGLRTTVGVLVNGRREVVSVRCGDPVASWRALVAEARTMYRAAAPANADVVIANAYPNDLSVTFLTMKGRAPLDRALPAASRIAVAACPEGVGLHQLFPLTGGGDSARRRRALKALALVRRPDLATRKVFRRAGRVVRPLPRRPYPAWLFVPEPDRARALPAEIAGMRVSGSWDEILSNVAREQGGRRDLRCAVYACSPLQWISA